MNQYAWSTPWGTVKKGAKFYLLPKNQQDAVIMHEKGHVRYFHGLVRILWVFSLVALFKPKQYYIMCEQQEFKADSYAKEHKIGLIAFLCTLHNTKHAGYPLPSERIQRLIHG